MSSKTAQCWCGNSTLTPFGPDYLHCGKCETLVTRDMAGTEISTVANDVTDLYGKSYWFEHQEADMGYPNIVGRARADLPERCLYWLRALLKYKLPAANVLELASAHGAFVALLRQAGFDATGLELSPWVVDFAQRAFGVPMLLGPIEKQNIEAGSLDAILMMDVLEHLPDPKGTLSACLNCLKPDGILLIQTPQYTETKSYEAMVRENDYFLNHMKGKAKKEHLFLYSRHAVCEMMRALGSGHVQFEPAIFAIYDMFFVASRQPLKTFQKEQIEQALLAKPSGRMALALMDLDDRKPR